MGRSLRRDSQAAPKTKRRQAQAFGKQHATMIKQTERGRQVRRNLAGIVLPAEERPRPAGSSGEPRDVVAPPVVVPFDPETDPAVFPPSRADGGVKTMSSLEIAEVTGKELRNVMRDIRTVLTEAGIGALKLERTYLDAQNNQRPCYHLPRFECDLVVSGYSVRYRAAIIRRWHELEAKEAAPVQPAVPRTYPEALRLAADCAERIEEQARLLESQRPAVESEVGRTT